MATVLHSPIHPEHYGTNFGKKDPFKKYVLTPPPTPEPDPSCYTPPIGSAVCSSTLHLVNTQHSLDYQVEDL